LSAKGPAARDAEAAGIEFIDENGLAREFGFESP
jgi:hypothetical protein